MSLWACQPSDRATRVQTKSKKGAARCSKDFLASPAKASLKVPDAVDKPERIAKETARASNPGLEMLSHRKTISNLLEVEAS